MSAVISLLTDFGLSDPYVGEMKGRILSAWPAARLVDLTHSVPAGDVAAGAFLLSRAWSAFPAGSVHLAVVDPGVGTRRAALAVEAGGHWFVGPDNGLLSIAAAVPDRIWQLDPGRVRPGGDPAPTFHGRDVFAPAAARILAGESIQEFAGPGSSMSGLEPVVERRDDRLYGEVLWVDHFGNAITAITADSLGEFGPEPEVRVGGLRLRGMHRTYGDVEPLTPLAYLGSGGTLELAVRDGDLSERYGVVRGSRVEIRRGG